MNNGPSNYEMAKECMRIAEREQGNHAATIEAMAAQTYATLALVDALRAKQKPAKAEKVASRSCKYVLANSPRSALHTASNGGGFTHLKGAKAHKYSLLDADNFDIYRVSMEVLKS